MTSIIWEKNYIGICISHPDLEVFQEFCNKKLLSGPSSPPPLFKIKLLFARQNLNSKVMGITLTVTHGGASGQFIVYHLEVTFTQGIYLQDLPFLQVLIGLMFVIHIDNWVNFETKKASLW